MKKKVKLYYVLRKLNPKADPKFDFTKYVYIHGRLDWRDCNYDIGAATLFDSREEAEAYKATHVRAQAYEVFEVDPRKICLSTTSCDDCSWGGTCPRHPND